MKHCQENAIRDYPLEYKLEKQIGAIYHDILKAISEVTPQTAAQRANTALSIKNYRLFHTAFDECEKGYYEVSIMLLRAMYENGIQMRYFADNNHEAELWLYENRKISQQDIRKKLDIDKDIYGLLSTYSHSIKSESLLPIINYIEGDRMTLLQLPLYSEEFSQMCIFIAITLAWHTIQHIQKTFPKEKISDKALVHRTVDLDRLIVIYVREHKLQMLAELEKVKSGNAMQQKQPTRSNQNEQPRLQQNSNS